MANVSFSSVPATKFAGNESGHYSAPLIPWFRVSGQPADYPDAFTPDIGSTTTFESNVDASAFNYIYNKTDSFWPVDDDYDRGFSIISPNDASERQFNYQIVGGKGHWMPCPIFKTISFYWGREGDNPGNWACRHVGLRLKNWKTDQELTWGSGMTNGNTNSQVIVRHTGRADEVRALGPDWFVYGVIFNFRRPSTSSFYTGKARLVDFRMGYDCSPPSPGTNKLILPKQLTWPNLQSALSDGIMKYEPS